MSASGETPGISITPPEGPGFPLTKEFLEIAFKKEVETFTATLGTNPGDNYLSIIHAVDVKFKGEKEESTYLIKCYPNHPTRREFLDQINVFEKELFMYEDFFPQLNNLRVIPGLEDEVQLSIAPYHGGNVVGSTVTKDFKMEPWSKENFIIMTDLRKSEGCKMIDRTKGVDIEHASLVLQEIAKFHANTWAYKQQHKLPSLISKYSCFEDQMYSIQEMVDQFKPVMDSISGTTIDIVKDSLGDDHPACVNLRKFLSSDMIELLKASVQASGIDEDHQESLLRVKPNGDENTIKDPWLVGAHGDCWVNNMLFRYEDHDDPSRPTKVSLVDFQICREACPTTDLAYFMCTSIRAHLRIPHERELLQVYHETFNRCCKAYGVQTLPGFTFENLQRRYRRSKLFGFLISLPLLSIVLKPQEESVDMDKSEGDNAAELFASVMEGADKNKKFREEMTASVLALYEDGVL